LKQRQELCRSIKTETKAGAPAAAWQGEGREGAAARVWEGAAARVARVGERRGGALFLICNAKKSCQVTSATVNTKAYLIVWDVLNQKMVEGI